jgi:O-antigen/teichoic acid export membrane protein
MSDATELPISQPPARALRSDTLADSVLILLALTVVQRMVGFGRALLFCRWLDAESLGQWDMAFSFLLLAAPLSVLAISSSFRRYVEHYRQQLQLKMLVRRTVVFYAVASAISVTAIWFGRAWLSRLVFGSPGHEQLVALLAVSLLAVLGYHFFIELLTSLRNIRLISSLQLLQSVTFAVVGISLLAGAGCTAGSVVTAYAAASGLVTVVGIVWLVRSWHAFPQSGPSPSQRSLWTRLIPFAAGVWIASLMGNLFEVADRYMIIHFSPLSPNEALGLVGQYHSSRVVPLLMVSVAAMIGSVMTPHLSEDWEEGRRDRVSQRLNLYLKLSCFAMSLGAVAVLFAAPLLFGVAFEGKFAGGLAVLPWTLTYCIWFGIIAIAQTYLWCAEKTRLASLALLAGLLANVGLNLILLPRLGLLGAVLATTAANLIALVIIGWFNHRLGFRMSRGTRVALALPLLLPLGPWIALVVLAAVAVDACCHDHLLSAEEKRQLTGGLDDYRRRLRSLRPGFRSAG